jgi:16S rRNA (uracil1498-N3)-methyltransferase
MSEHRGTALRRVRLHVDGDLDGATLVLDEARAHFLQHVMRLAPGDRITVFNVGHGEFEARIEYFAKRGLTLRLGARRREPVAETGPVLALATLKRSAMELAIEKATELGATRIVPVIARRSVVDRVNLDRLAAIAREAAEQCERLGVPAIAPPVALEKLLATWTASIPLIVADESGGGEPLAQVVRTITMPCGVLIGPEGGFAPEELDAITSRLFVRRVGLGPRVLRAETAVIATLAVLQAIIGDGDASRRQV